jgi:hypothetical protein
VNTSLTAASLASIDITIGDAHACSGLLHEKAPSSTNASLGSGERFHTFTSWPAWISRRAIATPIVPSPMKLTVAIVGPSSLPYPGEVPARRLGVPPQGSDYGFVCIASAIGGINKCVAVMRPGAVGC